MFDSYYEEDWDTRWGDDEEEEECWDEEDYRDSLAEWENSAAGIDYHSNIPYFHWN